MGGGGSKQPLARDERHYGVDRKKIRKQLIVDFNNDPKSQEILKNISDLRTVILREVEISATAQREAARNYDYSATCMEAAEVELFRLFKVHERSRAMRSAQARQNGFVACPYGHVCAKCESMPEACPAEYTTKCRICSRSIYLNETIINVLDSSNERITPNSITSPYFYHCSYCEYDLCDICCVNYCAEGHALSLWTLPEGTHVCSVCKATPIPSGYHCTECNIDVCDMCTFIPGRKAVQAYQLREMNELIEYLYQFLSESFTAKRLVEAHTLDSTRLQYMLSTRTLHLYVLSLREGKLDCQCETKQHRVWKEVLALRGEIFKENNATARREMKNTGNFTELEISRLKRVIQVSERARSVFARKQYSMGCPVGHYAAPYAGIPPTWYHLDRPPYCAICERLASEGCHCPICEYSICKTCSAIYCEEGHRAVMWTEPDADEATTPPCYVCAKGALKSGYYCEYCNVNICDECTDKRGRDLIRHNKLAELHQLTDLVKKYREKSDMAYKYSSRQISYITSMSLLCQYVNELRAAMIIAERQHRYFIYIVKMKSMRRKILRHMDLCAASAREYYTTPEYNFKTLREVKFELDRLKNILDVNRQLKSLSAREENPVACPLGHTMQCMSNGELIVNRNGGGEVVEADDKYTNALEYVASPANNNIGNSRTIENSSTPNNNKRSSNAVLNSSNDKEDGNASAAEPVVSVAGDANASSDALLLEQQAQVGSAYVERCKTIPHQCRICSTDLSSAIGKTKDSASHLRANAHNSSCYVCTFCEYYLCKSCSTIYCRKGHLCKLWTQPEAMDCSCDICYTNGITSGYHCSVCDIDLCDMCTTKDARNVLLMLPKKEYKEIYNYLLQFRHVSKLAADYCGECESYGGSSSNNNNYSSNLPVVAAVATTATACPPVTPSARITLGDSGATSQANNNSDGPYSNSRASPANAGTAEDDAASVDTTAASTTIVINDRDIDSSRSNATSTTVHLSGASSAFPADNTDSSGSSFALPLAPYSLPKLKTAAATINFNTPHLSYVLSSMSILCEELDKIRKVRAQVENELLQMKNKKNNRKYGRKCSDM